MRRVLLFVDLTLDGFMGGPDGEMDWLVPDDEMDKEFTTDLRETADTILTGRVAYESFAAFWPAAASDPASPADLVVFGGARTAQAFVRLGLVDEYRMKVHPVAIGNGLPLFKDLEDRVRLRLVHSKAYGSGVLGLRFEPAA